MLTLGPALVLSIAVGSAAPDACDAPTLAARIDQWIEARLAKEGISPGPVAEDAEFFRRLSLDLNGRIPSVAQLADFLDDRRPDKRRQWADELLDGRDNAPLYVNHLTNVWRRRLLANTPPQPRALVGPLEAWLRQRLQVDTPYDQIVRGLLTDPGAAAFRHAFEDKPENLAAATARLFLGIKLECAQCHDDRSGGGWTRRQFWQLAAFFAAPRAGQAPRLRIGGRGAWAEARFLEGGPPDWKGAMMPREVLGGWVARADNPWFARAAVNWIWRDLFGIGLVDPVDGLGVDDNPPSHPVLLDELARQFVLHDFDVKYLLRAIVGSRAYQRSSLRPGSGQHDDMRLFGRAAVRALTCDQLLDSVMLATGLSDGGAARGFSRDNALQAEFVALFEDASASPLDPRASMQQALAMMNSRLIAEILARSPALAAASGDRSSGPLERRITDLYLMVLSRRPRPEELSRMVKYFAECNPEAAQRDVLWALLNSVEFVVNH
jgi:Protein of unknown function (DUF1553)/Protein of unknown function (DUF1549)